MTWGGRLRKRLFVLLCGSILLGIQCPPIAVNSFKSGVTSWVAGSFSTLDLTPFTDLLIGVNTGGNQAGF